MVAQPDVCKALASAGLVDVFLKRVVFACGVGGGRVLFAEHVAKIEKMGLCARILGLREELPAMDELRNCEGHWSRVVYSGKLGNA